VVGRAREELRRCDSCRRETWFETPLCDDVTGEPLLDELACVECGTAVLIGVLHWSADSHTRPDARHDAA
jgi:hypothetical protein